MNRGIWATCAVFVACLSGCGTPGSRYMEADPSDLRSGGRTYAAIQALPVEEQEKLALEMSAHLTDTKEVYTPNGVNRMRVIDKGRRGRALLVLLSLGPNARGAVPALTRVYRNDGDIDVAYVLGNIGPAAKEAVPALSERLTDHCAYLLDHKLTGSRENSFLYIKTVVMALKQINGDVPDETVAALLGLIDRKQAPYFYEFFIPKFLSVEGFGIPRLQKALDAKPLLKAPLNRGR